MEPWLGSNGIRGDNTRTEPEHPPNGNASPPCPTGTAAVGQGRQIRAGATPGTDHSQSHLAGLVHPQGRSSSTATPRSSSAPLGLRTPQQERGPAGRGEAGGAALGGQGRAGPAAGPAARTAPHRACCSRRRHCSLRSGYCRSLPASNPGHGSAGQRGWGCARSHRRSPQPRHNGGRKAALPPPSRPPRDPRACSHPVQLAELSPSLPSGHWPAGKQPAPSWALQHNVPGPTRGCAVDPPGMLPQHPG